VIEETEPMGDFEQLQSDVSEFHAENQRLKAELERLKAENTACWDAVADLGGYLTPEQIGAELKRKGIDTTAAFERLRAALRARKEG
jgi:hypothetical protein